MPILNSKAIGEISEAAVALAFLKKGYSISKPFGDNQRYDLLVDDGIKIHRVQIKTGNYLKDTIAFNCCSTAPRGDREIRNYINQIEWFAIYCHQLDKVYIVPVEDANKSTMVLRLTPTKNGQTTGVKFAKDYEISLIVNMED